jgi:hypothetical protein
VLHLTRDTLDLTATADGSQPCDSAPLSISYQRAEFHCTCYFMTIIAIHYQIPGWRCHRFQKAWTGENVFEMIHIMPIISPRHLESKDMTFTASWMTDQFKRNTISSRKGSRAQYEQKIQTNITWSTCKHQLRLWTIACNLVKVQKCIRPTGVSMTGGKPSDHIEIKVCNMTKQTTWRSQVECISQKMSAGTWCVAAMSQKCAADGTQVVNRCSRPRTQIAQQCQSFRNQWGHNPVIVCSKKTGGCDSTKQGSNCTTPGCYRSRVIDRGEHLQRAGVRQWLFVRSRKVVDFAEHKHNGTKSSDSFRGIKANYRPSF